MAAKTARTSSVYHSISALLRPLCLTDSASASTLPAHPNHNGGYMELLTAELRAAVPRLYGQEREEDPLVYIKFFTPWSNWTWFVTEGAPEGDDFVFFGYVIGFEEEWGYFCLSELEGIRGPAGLTIER